MKFLGSVSQFSVIIDMKTLLLSLSLRFPPGYLVVFFRGIWVAQSLKRLLSGPFRSWDGAPRPAACSAKSVLLPLPLFLP